MFDFEEIMEKKELEISEIQNEFESFDNSSVSIFGIDSDEEKKDKKKEEKSEKKN